LYLGSRTTADNPLRVFHYPSVVGNQRNVTNGVVAMNTKNLGLQGLLALGLIAGPMAANAQTADVYYIQYGAFPTIGNVKSNGDPTIGEISATGFFLTSGVGTNTVTGFDITMSYGGESVNVCSSTIFGCAINDSLVYQFGVVDTGTQLLCSAGCELADRGGGYIGETFFSIGGPTIGYGFSSEISFPTAFLSASTSSPPNGYVIAASRPVEAPEIDRTSAASGLTLLLGGLAVLRGRREKIAA
jgi:hypothetical protein